jgi:hypothetical protein
MTSTELRNHIRRFIYISKRSAVEKYEKTVHTVDLVIDFGVTDLEIMGGAWIVFMRNGLVVRRPCDPDVCQATQE